LKREGRAASSFYDDYEPWPQVMINIGVSSTDQWKKKISAELEHADVALLGRGRVVVRPSGTQPVIRVMVEADEYELRDQVAEAIVEAMVRELGGEVHGRVDLTYALGD